MGLVGFEGPLWDEKKLLFEQENFDAVLQSTFTWSLASILNLKIHLYSENANIENEGAKGKNIWSFEISHFKRKRTENELTSLSEI